MHAHACMRACMCVYKYKSLMAVWSNVSLQYEMLCHDPVIMVSSPSQRNLVVILLSKSDLNQKHYAHQDLGLFVLNLFANGIFHAVDNLLPVS